MLLPGAGGGRVSGFVGAGPQRGLRTGENRPVSANETDRCLTRREHVRARSVAVRFATRILPNAVYGTAPNLVPVTRCSRDPKVNQPGGFYTT